MGLVVNKSFRKIRADITKKSDKLYSYLYDNSGNLYSDDWTKLHNKIYEKLLSICNDLVEEISNLDEIEIPNYDKEAK